MKLQQCSCEVVSDELNLYLECPKNTVAQKFCTTRWMDARLDCQKRKAANWLQSVCLALKVIPILDLQHQPFILFDFIDFGVALKWEFCKLSVRPSQLHCDCENFRISYSCSCGQSHSNGLSVVTL